MTIVSILVAASSRLVIFANWSTHQEEITELYCVNKGEPEMLCSGRCYLNDQLLDIKDDMQSSPETAHKITLQPWTCESIIDLERHRLLSNDDRSQAWFYNDRSGRTYMDPPSPPPRVI